MALAEKEHMFVAKHKELTSYFAYKVLAFTEIGKNLIVWSLPVGYSLGSRLNRKKGNPHAKARLVL